jgi:hypothetical protein
VQASERTVDIYSLSARPALVASPGNVLRSCNQIQKKGVTMRFITVFPLLGLFVLVPANAAIFKWTDANGDIQYGEHPPTGVNAESIKIESAPKSVPPTKSPQQQVEELDKKIEKKKQQEAKTAQEKQNEEYRKINCENAKYNIEQLNLGGHRLTRMSDGSYQRLDEEQKQAAIAKNEKAIEEYCK